MKVLTGVDSSNKKKRRKAASEKQNKTKHGQNGSGLDEWSWAVHVRIEYGKGIQTVKEEKYSCIGNLSLGLWKEACCSRMLQ